MRERFGNGDRKVSFPVGFGQQPELAVGITFGYATVRKPAGEQDPGLGPCGLDASRQLISIDPARHDNIGEDQIDRRGCQNLQRLRTGARLQNGVREALQLCFQDAPQCRVIFDDQYLLSGADIPDRLADTDGFAFRLNPAG